MVTEIAVTGVSSDGAGVGRDHDGRVVFIPGALPDETVTVDIVEEKKRHAVGRLVAVTEASPERIEPGCAAVARGCGGCDQRHVTPDGQRRLKEQVISDALTRIGRLSELPAITTRALPDEAYRTTARCTVIDGRAGYRERRSNEGLVVDACPVVHPLVEELLVEGRFDGAGEVTLRVGARTGERLVLADPIATAVDVPADVTVVGADELGRGRRAWYHEEAAGRRWRISARSFFQARPDGAEELAAVVGSVVGDGDEPLVDLYGGVGLFAGTLDWSGPVTLVERSSSAVADARVNLEGRDVKILATPVERWKPSPAAVVVADPARSGLGRRGVDQVTQTGCRRLVLVSCDAGALGRDAGLLHDAGFELDSVVAVDLFPQTSRVEVVAGFARG